MWKTFPFLTILALGSSGELAPGARAADSPTPPASATEQARAAKTELEQWWKAQHQEAEETARVLQAWAKDQRHPSRANLSGIWEFSAGAPGMGCYLLEQKGAHITGAEFLPACGGQGSTVKVTGIYLGGVLLLVRHFENGATLTDRMVFRERNHQPVFEGIDAPFKGFAFMSARAEPDPRGKAAAK